ncbi:hypothetical protein BALAC2494_01995 [Bifidobacterium animalis subsp. lactis CNCM I-2494]|uniref:Uncharacterized protein n=1 Tax=Bifidobacterium animalis subsp. lactis CNCM I-2494 TaxID=1042403 RepID=A0A806FTR4_BIFAN|nr:hypothetical protein BALAC2494_01995 [Bifidobacterium animalis subsp. lactis CNCM I-2494]
MTSRKKTNHGGDGGNLKEFQGISRNIKEFREHRAF